MLTHVPNIDCHDRLSGRRRRFRVFGFGLVLLGFCVFAWGLTYKLSLYYPPHSVSRRMPEAKLVSGKERTALPVVSHRQAPPSNLPLALTGLALLFFCLSASRLNPGGSGCDTVVPLRPSAVRALLRVHSVRPPPFVH